MPLVLAQHLAGFYINHIAFFFTQIATHIVVVVQFSEEANALRVLALGVHQMLSFGNGTHLLLPHVADGEQRLPELPVVELRQEVGLVLHGVGTRREPLPSVLVYLRLRIVTGGYQVVLMTALAVEGTELNHSVAHHVGVGRTTLAHRLHRVARHLVPVVAVAVHHLQTDAIPPTQCRGHLQVLLHRAVPLALVVGGTNLYIETIWPYALAHQFVQHHCTVDATREQQRHALVLDFFHVHTRKITTIISKTHAV